MISAVSASAVNEGADRPPLIVTAASLFDTTIASLEFAPLLKSRSFVVKVCAILPLNSNIPSVPVAMSLTVVMPLKSAFRPIFQVPAPICKLTAPAPLLLVMKSLPISKSGSADRLLRVRLPSFVLIIEKSFKTLNEFGGVGLPGPSPVVLSGSSCGLGVPLVLL